MDKPYRLRSQRYLIHIRGKPCLKCGLPGEAHHIQYAQPRALSLRTGDQYAVPLCHACHMELHQHPSPERTWWALNGIDPVRWADREFAAWSREYGALPPSVGNKRVTSYCPAPEAAPDFAPDEGQDGTDGTRRRK